MLHLTCHPAASAGPACSVAVRVRRQAGGELSLSFAITGDLARVVVPAPRAVQWVAGLWQHTCCEAFVALDGTLAYHEFNFSPSGEWAAFAFRGYREGEPLADVRLAPRIAFGGDEQRLELEAHVPLARLSSRHADAPLRLGLAAVVEADDGALSYWALRHPGGKPDFHDPAGWTLRLEPAAPRC